MKVSSTRVRCSAYFGSCILAPACSLPKILNEATRAFLEVLDRYTLADVLNRRADLRGLFGGFQPLAKTIKQVTADATDAEVAS